MICHAYHSKVPKNLHHKQICFHSHVLHQTNYMELDSLKDVEQCCENRTLVAYKTAVKSSKNISPDEEHCEFSAAITRVSEDIFLLSQNTIHQI